MQSRIILCFSLILIVSPTLLMSQSLPGSFEGSVLSPDGSPLPYVSVGVINEPIGTMSNEQGHFALDLGRASPQDTLKLSLVGYTSLEFIVGDLLNGKVGNVFHLTPQAIKLSAVEVIGKKRIKETTIGRKTRSGILQATFNPSTTKIRDKLGTEIGMKMPYSRKSSAVIKTFAWYISANNFNHLKFRVNIYALKNGLPDSLITHKSIPVEIPQKKTGWITLDLQPYHILVHSDFVVSLQWLDSNMAGDGSPKIWIPGAVSPFGSTYYRDASQDKWKRSRTKISYYVTLLY